MTSVAGSVASVFVNSIPNASVGAAVVSIGAAAGTLGFAAIMSARETATLAVAGALTGTTTVFAGDAIFVAFDLLTAAASIPLIELGFPSVKAAAYG
jgi:hypothetical protein